jgi:thioredoxin domain-containing protein 10
MRMSGAPVQQVTRVESFEVLKANNAVFFVYVGIQSGALWEYYYSVAENNQPYAYFYSTSYEVGSKHFEIDEKTPTILVFKENFISHYPVPEISSKSDEELMNLNNSLNTWVTQEKFLTFPRITLENFYQYRQTGKYLVLAIVEENKLNELITHEQEFRDMVERIIKTKRDKYHNKFQFGWTGTSLAHYIVSSYIKTPNLIVLNSTTNYHHMPDDDPIGKKRNRFKNLM